MDQKEYAIRSFDITFNSKNVKSNYDKNYEERKKLLKNKRKLLQNLNLYKKK